MKNNFGTFLQHLNLQKYSEFKKEIWQYLLKMDFPDYKIRIAGLDYFMNENTTLKSVGDKVSVSPERIRQLIWKFLKIVGHPKNLPYLISHIDSEYKKLIIQRDELQSRLNTINTVLCNYRNLTEYKNQNGEYDLNANIQECEFSIRTENCLKEANIKTLFDLCAYSETELLNLRNLGKKSLQEIKQVLTSMKLELRKC